MIPVRSFAVSGWPGTGCDGKPAKFKKKWTTADITIAATIYSNKVNQILPFDPLTLFQTSLMISPIENSNLPAMPLSSEP